MKLTLADVWDFDNDVRWYVAEQVNSAYLLCALVDHTAKGVQVHDTNRMFESQPALMKFVTRMSRGAATVLCVKYEDGHVALQRYHHRA
ncbi:hypothetical protein [Neorhizobium alkalisoli]|uniref:Uncharacterized protein n=1 Tax=Neorhizobium alkalisoli TaxID=528178 RepID=A0A561QHU5_9HYPH|nr:hypothetical protein [Neorhizobium alkalisoli]TWF49896.1 hypothetical protein FHW37_107267 [Neorhizobium alkalisoli]